MEFVKGFSWFLQMATACGLTAKTHSVWLKRLHAKEDVCWFFPRVDQLNSRTAA